METKYSYGSVSHTSSNSKLCMSSLLMPSNNSTSNPTRDHSSNQQTEQVHEACQLLENSNGNEIQMHSFGRKLTFEEVLQQHVTGRLVRKRSLYSLAAILAAAIGISFWFHRPNITDVPSTWKDSDLLPYGPAAKTNRSRAPFSILDPVADMGMYEYPRKVTIPARPIKEGLVNQKSYPTNSWYQSLLMPSEEPGEDHRAYAIPYVVDTVGPIPGLRIHPNHIDASSFVVQLYVINEYGLTVGAAPDAASSKFHPINSDSPTHQYKVTHATPLGVTMDWEYFPMHSSVTKGMPYATMIYNGMNQNDDDNGKKVFPTIAAEIALATNPIVDGLTTITCHPSNSLKVGAFLVSQEVELFFTRSDFTWIIFVSEPVFMQCILDENGILKLQVVDWETDTDIDRDLIVRIALSKKCTSGVNPIFCHQEKLHPTALLLGQGNYAKQLRKHARYFPGPKSSFDYEYIDAETSTMIFNWDMQDMNDSALHPVDSNTTDLSLIGFALPHHFDIIKQVPPSDHDIYCVSTLIGPACLYEGPIWELTETIPSIDFRAPRPPAPWAIPSIVQSLSNDMNFSLPKFYKRGEGDTYFSGKMLAKLGRILLIAEEVNELCGSPTDEYTVPCQNITISNISSTSDAVARLRSSVEVWINGTAVTPFVYDPAWGGVVSCGCEFDGDKGKCRNKFPHCTAFDDPGLNFGNAYYNDVHFHYGYFIFAAAVVAHFDPAWGRDMFENVLLLIRCIANPSDDDEFFPTWRHKDWFQGHSWASGIAMVFSNGKNQESSSEAIAAYEGIALYGMAMEQAWGEVKSRSNAQIALEVKQAGQLLTATELRSARKYWHVTSKETIKIYPSAYTPRTIGMLWQTMAQCQTWFGSAAYLAYGIQLLPITPISEYRDTLPWMKETYHIYAENCNADPVCTSNGWSILQLAILATVGHPEESAEIAIALPPDVFDSAGGNGHSLSNSLWYFATRPTVEHPLALTKAEKEASIHHKSNETSTKIYQVTDCGKPDTCTDYVLDTIAGEYTCRQRMDWLVREMGKTENDACIQIAREENPHQCGACDPEGKANTTSHQTSHCAKCTEEQCNSNLNRCPLYESTFVCTDGDSVGGCSSSPWDVPNTQCRECCELTHCVVPSDAELRAKNELACPPCSKYECHASKCASSYAVQYTCLDGLSAGGCSALPWDVQGVQCTKCCSLMPHCGR